MKHRVIGGALCGCLMALIYALAPLVSGAMVGVGDVFAGALWKVFRYTIMCVIGVLVTEIVLPAPAINTKE